MNSGRILELLIEQDLTISFAESMTGGFASYQLIKNSGASEAIKMSIVAYSNEHKEKILNISADDIIKHTVVSPEIALMMARSIKELSSSDIGVGVTGNAGPTVQDETEESVAYIGIVYNNEYVFRVEFHELNREEAIKNCVEFIYNRLEEIIG